MICDDFKRWFVDDLLTKWWFYNKKVGYPPQEDTWEPSRNLPKQYEIHLCLAWKTSFLVHCGLTVSSIFARSSPNFAPLNVHTHSILLNYTLFWRRMILDHEKKLKVAEKKVVKAAKKEAEKAAKVAVRAAAKVGIASRNDGFCTENDDYVLSKRWTLHWKWWLCAE